MRPLRPLHVTHLERLFQRHERIAFGHQFLTHIAVIIRRCYRPHDRRVVEFLVLVQFVPSWYSSSMEVPDVWNIVAYGGNYIALCLLHS